MKFDKYKNPVFEERDLINLIYQNQFDKLQGLICDDTDDIKKLSQFEDILLTNNINREYPVEDFDLALQQNWLMPEEYKNMDIEEFLVNQCPKENYQRLIDELQEYRARNMLNLLRWLKYFVDTCRKHNIIWGVGRGSSVASYTLYLLEVHKIDSLKYNLDWREFLR
jgi:DNA polymerase III alpha subunit